MNNLTSLNHNPDVLTCLANLSNDEVFTPPALANQVLNMLPEELWHDKNTKFLDPFTKSGVFLREIAKRLIEGLKDEIPDLQERLNHIYVNQLFGIAITELTSLLSRRSLYCSKFADGKYSTCTSFDNSMGNIVFDKIKHKWFHNKCAFCGASKKEYGGLKREQLETHAYQFIHTTNPGRIFDMKFDVIIGNPPYQLSTQQNSAQAKPLYHLFVEQAKKMNPKYLTMIIPSRWFAGGMGLDSFRKIMLHDNQIRKIVDFADSRECFPGVDIAGGICYFLWENGSSGNCNIINTLNGKVFTDTRPLNEFSTFIRYTPAVNIIKKVKNVGEGSMTSIISSVRPFGLPTKARGKIKGEVKLIHSQGTGYIKSSEVTNNTALIDTWKVMTSKASHDHAGQPDKDGKRRVLSRTEIMEPNSVCTESYILLGTFKSKNEAENCYGYVKTQFVRFLVSVLSFSQDITRDKFMFVPIQDFSELWTDDKLYKKYNLSEDEISFIESIIKPMDLVGGEDE